MIHFICYFVLFLNTKNLKVVYLYAAEVVFLIAAIVLYQSVYKSLSKLVLNNMLMLISISFIMLTRLSFDAALKQFIMVAASMMICLIVPIIIDKFKYLDQFGWIYAILGIILLALVLVLGKAKYGSKNWIFIFGYGLQPSEFVKIIFVFFVAALLARSTSFKNVVKVSVVSAIYVMILVLEKDLGAALIYFITYLSLLYVASQNPIYMISGLLAGSGASVVAYKLFNHVRVRVAAWKNPWGDIDNGGYQITSSLFAIATGGWFGMGLGQGLPTSIPVVESDFIFSAISEELGGIFAFCIILVYISCFIMFINISMKMKKQFYKLVALGLSVVYIFQVFISVGGVTKFIPSTGVTLPLISSGGSSVISTVLLFSIIQGLYVLDQDEDDAVEKERNEIE
jgi:Bacterial cell division membrane protein